MGGERPHPFHAALAKSINADFYKTANKGQPKIKDLIIDILKIPRDYDVYLSETIFIIPVMAKILRIIPKEAKIINIVADPVIYNMVNKTKNKLPYFLNKFLLKKVDGFIFVGPFGYLLNKIGIEKPKIEIFGGVNDYLFRKLIKVKHKKFNHNIIFIGNVTPNRIKYKGIDIVIEALKKVIKYYPDTKFFITGNSYINKNYPFVIFTGYKKLEEELKLSKFSLAIFMGRGDTFPIGALEAMLAGIPTIVSKDTGVKVIVNKVDPSFVSKLNSDELALKILKVFKMNNHKKNILSKKFRMEAMKFKESEQVNNFKNQYRKLLSKINK